MDSILKTVRVVHDHILMVCGIWRLIEPRVEYEKMIELRLANGRKCPTSLGTLPISMIF